MERLIDNALIYGKLMRVSQPHHVARYNAALEGLGIPRTELSEFSIDRTGFSREVAEEIGDPQYLDPLQINRRFILLSPEQSDLPVIAANFSSTSDLMQAFLRENERSLKILTLKDVVYGEIEDSTYRVDTLADILSIRRVKFHIRTAGGLLEQAREQERLLKRFDAESESWRDDDLLNRILGLAHVCGDTRTNGMLPARLSFNVRSFWTTHFGGVYVFQHKTGPAVVVGSESEPSFRCNDETCRYLPIGQRDELAEFLIGSDRLEPVNSDWLERTDIINQRLRNFLLREIAASDGGRDLRTLDDIWIKNWVHDNLDRLLLSTDFRVLVDVRKQLMNTGRVDAESLPGEHQLLISRANPDHPDRQLVNRLLSDLIPYDFVSRFILSKDAFYKDYAAYPETLRDYVVELIKSTYVPHKRAMRDKLFENWRLEDA